MEVLRVLKKDPNAFKRNWALLFIFLVISSLLPLTPTTAAPTPSGTAVLDVNQSISEANQSLLLLANYSSLLGFNMSEIEKLQNETRQAKILLDEGNLTLANETISEVWNNITGILTSKIGELNESLSGLKDSALNYSTECSRVIDEINNETEKVESLPREFYNATVVNETLKQLASIKLRISGIREELNSCIQRVNLKKEIRLKEEFIRRVLNASSGLLPENESKRFITQLEDIDRLCESGDLETITKALNNVTNAQEQLLESINETIQDLNANVSRVQEFCPNIVPVPGIDIQDVMESNNWSLVVDRIKEINETRDKIEQCVSLKGELDSANTTLSILKKYGGNLTLNLTALEGTLKNARQGMRNGNLTLGQRMLEDFWESVADYLHSLANETENQALKNELQRLSQAITDKNYSSVTEGLDGVLKRVFSPSQGGTTTTTSTTTSTATTPKPSTNSTVISNTKTGNTTGSTTSPKSSGGTNWGSILKKVLLGILGILALLAAIWFLPGIYYDYKQKKQERTRIKAAEEAVRIMGEILSDLEKKVKRLGISDSPTVRNLLTEMQQIYSRAATSLKRKNYVDPVRLQDKFSTLAIKLNSIIEPYETTFNLGDDEFKRHVAAKSYIGRRDNNEDYYTAKKIGGNILLAVADGMGGHLAGEVASRKAIEILEDTLKQKRAEDPEIVLREAIERANEEIYRMGHDPNHPERYNMGTTLTAAIVRGDNATIGNIGDSRTYLIRDGVIKRLTKDHSFVQELVDRGEITEAQAREHPQKNILTKALGISPEIKIGPEDIKTIQLKEGDYLLLCSDGLSDALTDEEIAKTVISSPSLEEAVDALIEKAYSFGSTDNITVVLYKHPKFRR